MELGVVKNGIENGKEPGGMAMRCTDHFATKTKSVLYEDIDDVCGSEKKKYRQMAEGQ